jgi:hypothetical protein
MSCGADASEKSRTPSPLNIEQTNQNLIDNRTFCENILTSAATTDGLSETSNGLIVNSASVLDNGN